MPLKGVEKIENILNAFLSEFETTVVLGAEFAYNTISGEIMYTLFGDEFSNNLFMKNFNKLAPDIDCDVFLASFLHELGHHKTLDLVEEDEEKYSNDCKREIEIKAEYLNSESDAEELEKLHTLYFNLPNEIIATNWAIEYIRENIEKIKELWGKVQDAVMEVYELNGVEV